MTGTIVLEAKRLCEPLKVLRTLMAFGAKELGRHRVVEAIGILRII